jgi:lysophospholipase L1-like esterase
MKNAKECALFLFVALLMVGCVVEVEKVVPSRVSADDVIDLRDPVGGSLRLKGTVYFGGVEAPTVLNWAAEDVFVQVPAGLTGVEVPVYVEVLGMRSNVTRLTILDRDPLLRIMCFGDSILYGGVPVEMQRLLDQDPYLSGLDPVIVDQGKPMEFVTREGTWPRWLNALDYHDFDVVILLEATNDVRDSAAVPMADIQESVSGMVDEAMSRDLDLILCSLLPRVGDCGDVESPTTEQYNAWLRPYAAVRGIPLIDLYQEFSSIPGWEQLFFDADDCIHPNAQGKIKIGEILTGRIEEMFPPS